MVNARMLLDDCLSGYENNKLEIVRRQFRLFCKKRNTPPTLRKAREFFRFAPAFKAFLETALLEENHEN